MRFIALFVLLMGTVVLTIVGISYNPTEPAMILAIIGVMAFGGCVAAYLLEDMRKPGWFSAQLTDVRAKYLIVKDAVRDPFSNFRLSVLFGITAGMGTAFTAMFLGCSWEMFFDLLFGGFTAGLIIATLVLGYISRKATPAR